MIQVAHRVWEVPVYLPYLQPPLTKEVIAEAEKHLGVQLPESYLALLHEQNGGYVRLTLPDSMHSKIWGIGPHFPTITDQCPQLDPSNAEYGQWVPQNSGRLIPFDGDGHWYLCFDYRNSPDPRVTLIDFETEADLLVSSSFSEFLASLRSEPEPNRLLVAHPASVNEVIAVLESQLKASFKPADLEPRGYPIRCCTLGATEDPQSVCVSPNEVPLGFVRMTDSRYSELKELLPGTGLLLPDHPEVKVIVDSSDGIAQLVREICHRSSFHIANNGG